VSGVAYTEADVDRFFAKVTAVAHTACWHWRATLKADGYGQVCIDKRTRRAHRVAYEMAIGPIPDNLDLDHRCRERSCVNPAHLEPVTRAENLRRQGSAVTHCPLGHEYTVENTEIGTRGGRSCRECGRARNRVRSRRRYAAQRAARLAGEPSPEVKR
jgi:hypothetical protein